MAFFLEVWLNHLQDLSLGLMMQYKPQHLRTELGRQGFW